MKESVNIDGEQDEFNDMGIEELFDRASEIVGKLEDTELPLEEAFKEYETGVLVLKALAEKLSGVQQKVKMITEDGVIEDFE